MKKAKKKPVVESERPIPLPAPVPAAPEKPDWVNETPDETTYDLTMYGDHGGSIQEIDLARAEYIALKAHLAKLRGYTVPEDANAPSKP